ncbi:MAG: glycerophosphodiester phosphodiesterase [Treponema sp.]|jgi:glycerophosphoryl diester phosphodiesterase|nr:glycerophosphodiester phosphodiesterase [Treponema sp.]
MKRLPVLADRSRPLLFAHRGCSSLAPENTMASFRKAREMGSPGIELDIHLCASGELVVAHDDTFLRIAGDPRNIEDLTYDEIRSIDVGSFFDAKFKSERVMLLEEVLEEFCPGMYIDIELKTRKTSHDFLPEAAAKSLQAFNENIMQSVTISSFNPFALRAFKKFAPQIPTALIWSLSTEVPKILRRGQGYLIAGCDYLKPEYAQVKPSASFMKRGPVIPWTIDDIDLAKKMIGLGCEGIISNKPQDLISLF